MSVTQFFDTLLLQPLMAIYDGLFHQILAVFPNIGVALVLFSVVLNLLLLPIYLQMEKKGQEGVQARAAMNTELARIKAAFSGRERYFYVRTIHRHYKYQPISALFASSDLYLQILVFATVYRYLADLPALVGTKFGPIADLSQPDGLLWSVNLLPIVMTLANVASTMEYGKDVSKRRQGLGLALLFLVLLYNSPSGLVLYWTCNNLFSLVRNSLMLRLASRVPLTVKRRIAAISALR